MVSRPLPDDDDDFTVVTASVCKLVDDLTRPGPLMLVKAELMADEVGLFLVMRHEDGTVETGFVMGFDELHIPTELHDVRIRDEIEGFVEAYLQECGAD